MTTLQVDRCPSRRVAGDHDPAASRPDPRSAAGTLCLKVMDTPNAPIPEAAAPAGTPADVNRCLGALLEQIAAGDQAAFAEFYELTSRRVFGMARRGIIHAEFLVDKNRNWRAYAYFYRRADRPGKP